MKQKLLQSLMLIAALLTCTHAYAHDFEAQNSDGVTIYYKITSSSDKTCEVTYAGDSYNSYSNEYTGSIVIPETVTYNGTTYSVTGIYHYAFDGCTGLTSITIPNSVTSIGIYAFYGCSGLTSVTIPNSVTSINLCAFENCSGLTYIELPGTLTSIGDYAFYSSSDITRTIKCNATVPPAVGQGVFSCNYLTIEVPFESVLDYKAVEGWVKTNYGYHAYKGKEVEGLYYLPISEDEVEVTYKDTNYNSYSGSIVIPAEIEVDTKKYKVTRIGDNAFKGCSGLTSITIPNSVTSIGSSAFKGCSGLTSITIPNSVTSIGSYAFYDCSGLTSITIPNSVTHIGGSAFGGCSGLTSITIPNSVTSIGSSAFKGCSGLTSITIPNSVTSIGSYAFYDCSGLTSITIPNSVTSIGDHAFKGCSGLTYIELPSTLTSIGNYAFDSSSGSYITRTIKCNATVPPAVGQGVFYSNNLTIEVPFESVLDYKAVEGWTNGSIKYKCKEVEGLYYMPISENEVEVTYKDTNYNSYSGSIVIPAEITANEKTYIVSSIGNSAFRDCLDLTSVTIPNSVTSIGDYAFSHCRGFTSVTIPNSVTSIGGSAFSDCRGLTYIELPGTLTSIGSFAFDSSSGSYITRTIKCNATVPPAVGKYAFSGNKITIEVPFESVLDYKSVEGWVKTNYDYNAYKGKEVEGLYYMPISEDEVEVTYKDTNYNSYSGSIVIPAEIEVDTKKYKVTRIGDNAFKGCSGLTSVTIPNSVTSIGDYAFSGCTCLASVNISDLEAWCKIDFGSSEANPLNYAKKLYLNGELLTELVIPDSISEIKDYAFYYCSSLTSVSIPNCVTSIGDYAFKGCSGLTSVLELPSGIESIGNNCFSSTNYNVCRMAAMTPPTVTTNSLPSNISLVLVPTGSKTTYTADAVWGAYTIIEEGSCDIEVTNEVAGELTKSIFDQTRKNLSNVTSLIVHGTLNANDLEKVNTSLTSLLHLDISDTDVTEIAAEAFLNKSTLMSIKLPKGLKSIGNSAFSGCSVLSEEFKLPETLEVIGDKAFENCIAINGVLCIPASVNSIGSYAFAGCRGINAVDMSKSGGLTSMLNNAFYNCSGLKKVDMSGVTELVALEQSMFKGCTSLRDINLSETLKIVRDYAFYGCSELDNLQFPASLQSVGHYAFQNCSKIKDLSFDGCEYLVSIGSYAFSNCAGLETLSFADCKSMTTFSSNIFSGCTSLKEVDMLGCTSITAVSDYMFSDCTSLQAVKLPSSMITLGSYVFKNCTGLEVVNLEGCKKLSNIYNTAFSGCTGLKLLDITECTSLRTINSNTFSTCSALETVNFPSSLTSIGASAFANCTNLQHMSVPCSTPPAIENNANPFAGVDNVACVLSIPSESFFNYYEANYWGGFVDIENKSDIQLEVEDPEESEEEGEAAEENDQSNGCQIYYERFVADNASLALTLNEYKASLTDEGVEKIEISKAITGSGQSVFVGNGDAITFYFTPANGKEIDIVLYNGEDVTSELVENTYTTPEVNNVATLKVIMQAADLTGVDDTFVEECGVVELERYDISGRLLSSPVKGLNIVKMSDGSIRKMLVK